MGEQINQILRLCKLVQKLRPSDTAPEHRGRHDGGVAADESVSNKHARTQRKKLEREERRGEMEKLERGKEREEKCGRRGTSFFVLRG